MDHEALEVRAARVSEVDAVVALVDSAYRGEPSRAGWTTEADLLDGQRTDADEVRSLLPHILVTDDLTACCVVEARGERAHFGMFAVRPGLQGRGVGSSLLAAAEARARSLGLTAVEMTVLSARSDIISFYERRGYVVTGETRPFPYGDERYGRPRTDDLEFVVLRKTLAP